MEKNYYLFFSDCKKSVKVPYEDFISARSFAISLNAILSVVHHRFGLTLYVAFPRFLFYNYKLYCYELLFNL